MNKPGIDISFCWDFEDYSPEDGLSKLKDFQFDGIELWPKWIEKFGAQRWADAFNTTGMKCFQLCPYFDFVHGEAGIAKSRNELAAFLRYADIIGCTRLRVFTGPVPLNLAVGSKQANEQQWNDTITTLSEFCAITAAKGIELCLECHEGMLMEDSPGALRILQGVNKPNLTANPQIPLLNEEPWTTIENLGPFTSHIHIHNWVGEMTMENLTYLSEGEFDWQPVIQALVHDYKRHVCLSIEHPRHSRKHDSWETARRDGPFLAKLRQSIV